MNRIGILLASGCAGLALLVAAFGGVRSYRPAAAVHAAMTEPKKAAQPAADSSSTQDDNDEAVIRFVKNPEPIPLFMAHDLDGNVISTAAYKGKVVLVNFWATWCPPCREEIPELIKLQDKYKDQLQVLAISEDEAPAEALKAFARQAHINYPIMKVTEEIETDFGGVPALPTLFVINKDGAIVQKHVGFYPVAVYDREIRALAGMSVDAKIETFEDTGQIFLKNAKNATELPGVDLSKLTPAQKQVALKRMNSESCTCGCRLTLAQCRINDTACPTSRQIANKIVQEILSGNPSESPAKSDTTMIRLLTDLAGLRRREIEFARSGCPQILHPQMKSSVSHFTRETLPLDARDRRVLYLQEPTCGNRAGARGRRAHAWDRQVSGKLPRNDLCRFSGGCEL